MAASKRDFVWIGVFNVLLYEAICLTGKQYWHDFGLQSLFIMTVVGSGRLMKSKRVFHNDRMVKTSNVGR